VENDWVAAGLAVAAGFLLFIGGWSLFASLDIASELGVSSGFMFEGISLLSVGQSIGILVAGVVCAFFAYRFSSVARWSTVESLLVFVLVVLVVLQVVYARQDVNLPPGGGGTPSSPKLGGWVRVYVDDVALSGNVPFGIYYNDVRVGSDARFTLDSDLSLTGVDSPSGSVQYRVGVAYAPMTASGRWGDWVSFPVVKSVSPQWRRSGSGWKASVRDLYLFTLYGTEPSFFSYGKCKFRMSVYAAYGSVSTEAASVEFVLEARSGSLEIEYAGGWVE